MKNPRLNITVQQGDIDMLNAIKDTKVVNGGASSYSSAIRKALREYCVKHSISGYAVALPADSSTEDEDDETW